MATELTKLIEYAESLGLEASDKTKGGHLKVRTPGGKQVMVLPSSMRKGKQGNRAVQNYRSELKRAARREGLVGVSG